MAKRGKNDDANGSAAVAGPLALDARTTARQPAGRNSKGLNA